MKKSIIFAILAAVIYLISTSMIAVWSKQLNLYQETVLNNISVKEKFHHLNINANIKGFCEINITQGSAPILRFEKFDETKAKFEHFVKNDTLFINMIGTEAWSSHHIEIISGTLGSIIASSKNEMTVSALMNGSAMRVILNGKASFTEYNSRIDTLNIQPGKYTAITIDTCRIKTINIFRNKSDQFNFNITRSLLPEIRQFDEGIIPKPSE